MPTPKLKLDAGLFDSPLGRGLLERFGGDGIAFYFYLMCAIRRDGYYVTADELFKARMADELHISRDKLRQIFNHLMRQAVFDRGLYQSLLVLTSEEIQRDYFQRTKKAGTPPVWLIACGTPRQEQEVVLPESFSPALYEAAREWIQYKNELRKGYGEVGLRAFIREIERRRMRHGDEKIAALILESMSNRWQGIAWDRLERGAYPGKPVTQNRSAVTAGSSIDKDDLRGLIHRQFFEKEAGVT